MRGRGIPITSTYCKKFGEDKTQSKTAFTPVFKGPYATRKLLNLCIREKLHEPRD